ncbi:hypothetical protein PDESU_05514 [Pontiella desulfatans]|uniref:Uncharacterized protein n=1 Tax=Pontiella desulfatans TaxID=2750659 RepID=A0A6C2U9Z3_PONDE|nr:hypothetical protein [Pontiella desulfatans]VGO16922.1 hypothetical protein PDESU_05514 [Pontiella desulfatans]
MSKSKKNQSAATEAVKSEYRPLLLELEVDVYDLDHYVIRELDEGDEYTCTSLEQLRNTVEALTDHVIGNSDRICGSIALGDL